MQTIYWLFQLISFTSLYLSHRYKHKKSLMTIFLFVAQAISIYRTIVRIYDFEKSQYDNKDGLVAEYQLEQEPGGTMVAVNSDFILGLWVNSVLSYV